MKLTNVKASETNARAKGLVWVLRLKLQVLGFRTARASWFAASKGGASAAISYTRHPSDLIGFRVQGLGLRVQNCWGLGFKVEGRWGLRFRV